MFEESLLESAHLLRTQNRWPAFASVTLQAAIAMTIVAIPLMNPAILPMGMLTAALTPPVPSRPTPPPVQRTKVDTSTTAVPTAETFSQPPKLFPAIDTIGPVESVPPTGIVVSMTGPEANLNPLLTASHPAIPHIAAAVPTKPLPVSLGVSAGLLLAPIQPVYPIIAKASRIEGTVVIHAIISKDGRVESASVVSGPQLLLGAALDAVRLAHYRPYLLNGEPTEVETTFSINFRMNT